MGDKPQPTIADSFGSIPDPRSDHTKRHKLLDILTIAICGAICGADTWVDSALFGQSKQEWFQKTVRPPTTRAPGRRPSLW